MILGIDVGGSTTKIVGLEPNGKCIGKLQVEAGDQTTSAYGAFGKFASSEKLSINDIKQIVLTGVGSSHLVDGMYGIPTKRVDEFVAIGLGGLALAKLPYALIVSVGTGTALVRADKTNIKHIGGSGVGGGMLLKLAERFAGIHSLAGITEIASLGDLSAIDLQLKHISKERIGNLPPEATVSNFGNLKDNAQPADIVIGLINLIFESIGMMAVFATLEGKVKDVVVVGAMALSSHAPAVFDTLSKIHPVKFYIPKDAMYATALGAALSEIKHKP